MSILIVFSMLLARYQDRGGPSISISSTTLHLCAVLLTILHVLFPRRPDLFTPDHKFVDLERSASAFGRYSMQWCTTALALAGRDVPLEELPVLDYATRSKSQPLLVASSRITLWDRILAERYFGFAKQWGLMFARSIVTFGSPYCVMQLLKSLEENHGQTTGAWIWLTGIGVFSLSYAIINYYLIWIQWSEMGVPIRAQLIIAIFQKALKRKDSKDQGKTSQSKSPFDKSEPINLISSDTLSFSKFTAINYIIPGSFVRFSFAVLFLLKLLGWKSTFVGMTVTILCVPIHTFVIKQQRAAQQNLRTARDKKTKVITEALHALRQIKFSALEAQWEDHIETFRQEEINHLQWSFTLSNIRLVWGVAAPFLVAAASICMYAYLQGRVTPSIMFPMIEVLPHLQGTLGFVPVVFQDYFGARANASRMDEFLRRPEQKNILGASPSSNVSFQNASIAWPSDEADSVDREEKPYTSPHRFTLEGLNLNFPVGELSVVFGKTGSGKSLLLAAIIGEVELLTGTIDAPSMTNGFPVAFVSQNPWLQNCTIKDNILFGNSFDKERYEKVLTACALRPDLAALDKGDETQIGLRGVKLSGGQRARLTFGRALYSRAKLLVLDDIFSALDSRVSKDVFNALTGELCIGRTRILVTHQVSLCLPKAKYIVHLENNSIRYAGNIDSVDKVVESIEVEVSLAPKSRQDTESNSETSVKTRQTNPVAKMHKKLNTRNGLSLYKSYFSATGGLRFTLVYILGFVAKHLLSALTTWLLSRTKSKHQTEFSGEFKTLQHSINVGSGWQQYLYLYIWSSLLAITLEFLFNLHNFSGSIHASKTLFQKTTFKVIRMPILWLDTTPIGGLLKGFTIDTRLVDDSVIVTMSDFADSFVQLMTVVGIG